MNKILSRIASWFAPDFVADLVASAYAQGRAKGFGEGYNLGREDWKPKELVQKFQYAVPMLGTNLEPELADHVIRRAVRELRDVVPVQTELAILPDVPGHVQVRASVYVCDPPTAVRDFPGLPLKPYDPSTFPRC